MFCFTIHMFQFSIDSCRNYELICRVYVHLGHDTKKRFFTMGIYLRLLEQLVTSNEFYNVRIDDEKSFCVWWHNSYV